MNILVTGGLGFIGSNFIRYMFKNYNDVNIINVDKNGYASNTDNVNDIIKKYPYPKYTEIINDINKICKLKPIMYTDTIDYIVNFAAESHVDNSIKNPSIFVESNVLGTQKLLDFARAYNVKRFLQISTDEVYGSLGETGSFTEESPLKPSSPYSASKTSADLIALSYFHTFGLDVCITRCSNNYGPYQFPEKLIPLMILNALHDKPLPVYGTGNNVRNWIHVEDHCSAVAKVLFEGKAGEIYNIGSNDEKRNIDIIEIILNQLKKPKSLIKYVEDRKGHDWRYSINFTKINNTLNWSPEHTFESGIKETIDWYVNNKQWWEKLIK